MPHNGLQNERTALAWQRTALALLVAAAVTARLTYDRLGPAAVIVSAAGVTACCWVFWHGRARYRQRNAPGTDSPLRGGRSALALTVAVVAVACLELLGLADPW
ncbi:DUF202 domain-containing protein [Nocardioides coralli]|uniref:DUF202 domain-containing protein n=1 Tax=Nocardioides coralli TaxID=2872154 RepID=UPI001CA40901|nr:DUF202 domain-containing protein [Nocardioides coralli]QZY30448.1 DUF202 domain-containing protein [Nocardioides coralli]